MDAYDAMFLFGLGVGFVGGILWAMFFRVLRNLSRTPTEEKE